jgi:hypothetical protein
MNPTTTRYATGATHLGRALVAHAGDGQCAIQRLLEREARA